MLRDCFSLNKLLKIFLKMTYLHCEMFMWKHIPVYLVQKKSLHRNKVCFFP